MKCQNCNTEHSVNFCPNCGTPANPTSQGTTAPPTPGPPQAIQQPYNPQPAPHQLPYQVPMALPQKKKMGCVKIGGIVLAVIIVLGAIGSLLNGKGNGTTPAASNAAKPSSSASQAVSSASEIEYIEITATELLAAYDENEIAADKMYKDKMLKVTGTVGSIGKDITNNMYITLVNEANAYSILSVQCYFSDKHGDILAELKEGDSVTIIGKCSGSSLNIVMKNCEFI